MIFYCFTLFLLEMPFLTFFLTYKYKKKKRREKTKMSIVITIGLIALTMGSLLLIPFFIAAHHNED